MRSKKKSSDDELRTLSAPGLLEKHRHGEITDLEVVLTLLSVTDTSVVHDAVAALSPSLLARLEHYVSQYEPDAPVFNGPRPNIETVQYVKTLLGERRIASRRAPSREENAKKRKRRAAG